MIKFPIKDCDTIPCMTRREIPVIALACATMALLAAGMGMLTGCDTDNNYDLLDCRLRFDYADIRMMDGTTKTVRVAAWSDASNRDMIRITDTDGVSWLTHLNNVILRTEEAQDVR